MQETTIRIAGIVNDSITDGPGLRLTVFTQGCPHACPGCHNPQTHAMDGGYDITLAEIFAQVRHNPLLSGITLSGGEPFLQARELAVLAEAARNYGYNVIVYTGFTWAELLKRPDALSLIRHSDYVIDGRFVQALMSYELEFKGSSNQRIIDIARSMQDGAPLAEPYVIKKFS